MTDIIVPIDYTPLKQVIPPGETILYSDVMRLSANISLTDLGSDMVNYETHALITDGGVAFTIINSKRPTRKGRIELYNYYPWDQIKEVTYMLSMASIEIHNRKAGTLILKRNKKKEDKNEFFERKKEFIYKFAPIFIQKREEWLRSPILNEKGRTLITGHKLSDIEFGYRSSISSLEKLKKKEEKRKLKAEKKKKKMKK